MHGLRPGRIVPINVEMKRASSESGFTLIEILVVMLILGLLAAIALPTFLNQRDKATDADAKVMVRTAQTAAETLATDNSARYNGPNGVTVDNLRQLEPSLTGANLTVELATANEYTVRVASDTGNWFEVHRNPNSTANFPCSTPGSGGCPDDGTWSD